MQTVFRCLLPLFIMQSSLIALEKRLRHEIESVLGFALQTPRDFECLRAEIFEQQHVHISVSTLKRYWGYVKSAQNYRPNRYTLRILSRFVGYEDWEAFVNGEKMPELGNKEKEKQRLLDASLARIDDSFNIIYKEMEAIKMEMVRLRSFVGEAETDSAVTSADVVHGD